MAGALAIDYGRRRVTVGGAPVELTATEYQLLRVLSLDAGRVAAFETLQRRVWPKRETADANWCASSSGNLRKLGDSAARPACLLKERGVGWRMAMPPGG